MALLTACLSQPLAHAAQRASGLLLGLALLAAPLSAQTREFQAPHWMGNAAFLGIDAALGGLTAGLYQRVHGGSFRDGFARGVLGGTVSFAGRRLSAERFGGAGLLGREVSAVGASVVRNASDARPSLDRILFPIGPVHVYIDRSAPRHVRAKLNLYSASRMIGAALAPGLHFDLGRSLSAGAPVFRTRYQRFISHGDTVVGMMGGGTIFLSGPLDPENGGVFAHERVHVLQEDFLFYTWSDPIEQWVATRSRVGSAIYRYIDFGVTMPYVTQGFYGALDIEQRDQPSELEAEFFEDR